MREVEISEIWQSLCCLSDAQDALTPDGGRGSKAAVYEVIDHAKAHLGRILEWAKESDHCAFIMAIRPARCTINEDQGPHLAEPEGGFGNWGRNHCTGPTADRLRDELMSNFRS